MKCQLCAAKSKYEVSGCSINAALKLAGTKWILPTLLELQLNGKPMRFGELEKQLFPITPKILSNRLASLEKEGMIFRRQLSAMPRPAVEYRLTEKGMQFTKAMEPLVSIYEKNAPEKKRCRVLAKQEDKQKTL